MKKFKFIDTWITMSDNYGEREIGIIEEDTVEKAVLKISKSDKQVVTDKSIMFMKRFNCYSMLGRDLCHWILIEEI